MSCIVWQSFGFIYLPVDIKKNSEDIQPHPAMYHLRHEQWPQGPCTILCDMRINTYIQGKSNDGYSTVELKLHKNQSLRCTLIWHNAVCSFHFPPFQHLRELGDTEYRFYLCIAGTFLLVWNFGVTTISYIMYKDQDKGCYKIR